MTLTQKETLLLKDLTAQEKLCIEKYDKYAADACDCKLKNLFTYMRQIEQSHLDTLNQIAQGQVPSQNSGSQPVKPDLNTAGNACQPDQKQSDAYLCQDALTTEKHASSLYDTSIFEFVNPQLRQILNHIQKEEQQHGEDLYCYMTKNGIQCG